MPKKKKRKKEVFSKKTLPGLLKMVFLENPRKTLNYKQVSKLLKIKDFSIKVLVVDLLSDLCSSSFIKEIKRGHYQLNRKKTSSSAVVKNTSSKGLYLDLGKGEEAYVPKKLSLFALAGDEVEVGTSGEKKRKHEVFNVYKRRRDSFVGIIDYSSSNYFLIPDDRRVYFDVFIPSGKVKKEHLNKKVLVKITDWESGYKNPVGEVVKIIGDLEKHATALDCIVYDYGFSPSFSKEIISLAASKKLDVSKKMLENRLDYRSVPTFTIDPEDAKDFDDALSVKKKGDNLWEVGVHIADVSHYVTPGSLLDKEALKRGNSVYLADRVIPMLPEFLSNNLCSLKPDEDRLAYSVLFEIDEHANVLNYKIVKTIICSDFRFTYDSAEQIINKKAGSFKEELLLLEKLSSLFKKERERSGAINFESSELKFVLDKDKKPIDVYIKKAKKTNSLIEEFMLLANKTVGEHLTKINSKQNFIFRIHDLPNKEKLSFLSVFCKQFGYTFNFNVDKSLSKSLNSLLKECAGSKEQKIIETLIAKSMSKAAYNINNIGHYGLAFSHYTHFTSPIRRYADLIVHRILFSVCEKTSYQEDVELGSICNHCSETERAASQAERESLKYMQAQYFKNEKGKKFFGIISGVTEWGFYVELEKNGCEGLVKVNTLKDDHYVYNEKNFTLTGYRFKKQYQLGQKVKVKVLSSDLERKQIYFSLI